MPEGVRPGVFSPSCSSRARESCRGKLDSSRAARARARASSDDADDEDEPPKPASQEDKSWLRDRAAAATHAASFIAERWLSPSDRPKRTAKSSRSRAACASSPNRGIKRRMKTNFSTRRISTAGRTGGLLPYRFLRRRRWTLVGPWLTCGKVMHLIYVVLELPRLKVRRRPSRLVKVLIVQERLSLGSCGCI